MPFDRPALTTLIDRTAADVEVRLPGTDPRLRRNVLGVLARVLAGLAHGLYGYLDWLARQLMPDSAEAVHLERWADIWGITRNAAVAATGTVEMTGISEAYVPAGTVLRRSDGAEATTAVELTITGGTDSVAVTAVVPGASSNTAAGSTLTFTSPLSGVDNAAKVDSDGLSGGADVEDDEALRARLLTRIQQPPHGGADFDYGAWALEISGVTRVWVYPEELGPGAVTVRFVRDDDASIIPDAGEVTAVQAHIDALRPVTATVTVVAPVAAPLDFEIAGLSPSDTMVQAAIEAELADLLRREAEPGGTILISHIREAISSAAGEWDHSLVSPSADVTHATGEIALMGTITWS